MNYISNRPKDSLLIKEDDLCIIHISEHNRLIFKVTPGSRLQTKFGHLNASDLIGHHYGEQFECKRGWVLPLRVTPELWTQLLPHRTQILYQADISMILLHLDIKPGSVVVESGTGSGSLSHSILRSCLPHGFLHTFEINEARSEEAQKEFVDHGYEGNVKVYNQDVCCVGFGDELEGKVDACMLDLPKTWDAIEHAHKVLKADGSRLCTFSPCVEQVQQNVARMTELKFKDIVTYECLMRPLEVKEQKLRIWTQEVLDQLIEVDEKRFANIESSLQASKKTKLQESGDEVEQAMSSKDVDISPGPVDLLQRALIDPKTPFSANLLPKNSYWSAKRPKESVSHSGFLTFASKRP